MPSSTTSRSRHTSGSGPGLLVAALLASGLSTLGPATPAAAATRPDLQVGAVAAPATAEPGGRAALTAVVRNAGRRDARTTTTRFWLSRDTARGGSDPVLGSVRTRALERRARRTVRLTADLPGDATGRWYVVACADARRQVREAKEGNNCRSSGAVDLRTPPTGPQFPLDPDPQTVGASTLEPQRRASAVAGTDAPTTITATGSDGTSYSLRVPAGALLGDEQITLTPVSAVAGLPLAGGLRAGVQLEPHGLMLQRPATLVIDGPDLGALAAQTPFVFHEGGEDLHAYPVADPQAADDADVVRLQLTHFSTAGVGSGTAADRAGLADHPPARSTSQLASTIAELTRAERASQEAGNPPDPGVGEQQVAALEAFAQQVVVPQLDAASGSPELAPGAISQAIAVARQLALLDEDNPAAAQLLQKAAQLLRTLVTPWDRRCQGHDIRAIGVLVGIARQLLLLGASDEGDPDVERAFDAAVRCSSYRVELDSTLDHSRNWSSGDQTVTTAGHVRMESSTDVRGLASGTSPLSHTEASLHQRQEGDGAWVQDDLVSTTPGQITVDVLERANPIDPGPGGTPAPPVPYVRLLPGVGVDGAEAPPTERVRKTSSLGGEPQELDMRFWMDNVLAFSSFYPLRIEEELEPQPGDAVLLEKTRDGSVGSVASIPGLLTEHRVLTVTHTPQPG